MKLGGGCGMGEVHKELEERNERKGGVDQHIVYLFEIPKEEIKTHSKNLHDELFSS